MQSVRDRDAPVYFACLRKFEFEFEIEMHDSDPYGSGFNLFVVKSLPYGLARLRCCADLLGPDCTLSWPRVVEVNRPVTQSLRISPCITAWLYPQSDPM